MSVKVINYDKMVIERYKSFNGFCKKEPDFLENYQKDQ